MADQQQPGLQGAGAGEAHAVTLTIEPGPGNRLGVLYDMLRDLGLEQCETCHVWKPTGRIAFLDYHHDRQSNTASYNTARCTDCILTANPDVPAVGL